MERITRGDGQRDWYIFDERYRLHISEDGLAVCGMLERYRESLDITPTAAPHIDIFHIGARLLGRAIIYRELPLSIEFSGSRVGSYAHNTGYDAAANGLLARPILEASIGIVLDADFLQLDVACLAGPLDSIPSGYGDYSASERFHYRFNILHADVPEVLNMNEDMRFAFKMVLKGVGG